MRWIDNCNTLATLWSASYLIYTMFKQNDKSRTPMKSVHTKWRIMFSQWNLSIQNDESCSTNQICPYKMTNHVPPIKSVHTKWRNMFSQSNLSVQNDETCSSNQICPYKHESCPANQICLSTNHVTNQICCYKHKGQPTTALHTCAKWQTSISSYKRNDYRIAIISITSIHNIQP